MSELKAIKIELNNHGKPIASIQGSTSYYGISPNDTFYSQEEADKVIAELNDDNFKMEKLFDARNSRCIELQKQIRHHKYKRCLAMADYCESQYHYYITLGNGFWLVRGDKMTRDTYHKRGEKFLTRWNKIWLALAEEPTWAKFLQLIHKETAKDGM